MDVKQYFRKVREIEASLSEEFPVVVSLDTPDGGKAGLVSEVNRQNAAKMIAEGRAMIASDEQRDQFYEQRESAKKASEKAELARRLQVAILSEHELQQHVSGRRTGGK